MAVGASPIATPLDDAAFPQSQPDLVHTLRHDSSVLALAVSAEHNVVFAGTQDGEIVVWDLDSFRLRSRVQAHHRAVLSLKLSPDGTKLFSTAGDAFVNVWCPQTLQRQFEIFSTFDVGDIFSVAYSEKLDMVYFGAQDSTIQHIKLGCPKVRVDHNCATHPERRSHRFFDSKAVGGTSTPRRVEERWNKIPSPQNTLQVNRQNIYAYAHYGFVFCMLLARGATMAVAEDEDVLISGGGDGTVKLWRLEKEENGVRQPCFEEIASLGEEDGESVMSLAVDGSFLYAGKLNGSVELWHLDTRQRLRLMKADADGVMAIQLAWGSLWSASAKGLVTEHNTVDYQHIASDYVTQKYRCINRWSAHKGKILASCTADFHNERFFITGANDNQISIWRVRDTPEPQHLPNDPSQDAMMMALQQFIAIKSVSSRPELAEECYKGATFLGSLFKKMGAEATLLRVDGDYNPVVLATFRGKRQPAHERRRILFYGHYDVVPAHTDTSKWASDPFEMTGMDGYLHGRGVSDNKGPIMAALFSVADLAQSGALENDIVFLIEGEEEHGSRGFQEIIRHHKSLIGSVDYILLANSYWLDDEVPCLTYGLRGILHATICVDSALPNVHSGVDGSCLNNEPLSDLTCVIASLKGPHNHVRLPKFYHNIPPISPEEDARLDKVVEFKTQQLTDSAVNPSAQDLKKDLLARWCEPNLTIHRYKVSGPDGSLVSSHAHANISLRLVPGQELDDIAEEVKDYLTTQFADLDSTNKLTVNIDNSAEAWIGDPQNHIFQTLEAAITKAWAPVLSQNFRNSGTTIPTRPLYIREGGSIPAVRFLEKEFGAPAAHFPCGQKSDGAHLENERLRVLNLLKAREIFGDVFKRL